MGLHHESCSGSPCQMVLVDTAVVPIATLILIMNKCGYINASALGDLAKGVDCRVQQCWMPVRDLDLEVLDIVLQVKFPDIVPSLSLHDNTARVRSKNVRKISPIMERVCACSECGNKPLFSDSRGAFNKVRTYKSPYAFNVDLQIRPGMWIMIPYAYETRPIEAFIKGTNVKYNFKSIDAMVRRVKKSKFDLHRWIVSLPFLSEYNHEVSCIRLMFMRDHVNNLVMCFYGDNNGPKIMLPLSEWQNVSDAIKSCMLHTNRTHAMSLLRFETTDPFPVFSDIVKYAERAVSMQKNVDKVLWSSLGIIKLPIELLNIVVKYMGTLPTCGPLEGSSLKHLFISPLFTANLLEKIGLTAFAPRDNDVVVAQRLEDISHPILPKCPCRQCESARKNK